MTTSGEHADVIVIGLGTIGSMAAWQIAASGRRVIGLEQYGFVHPFGGFTGESRLFRTAYHEGSMYVPLLLRARELWQQLNAITGRDVFLDVGTLSIGVDGDESISNVIASVDEHGLDHERLSADDLRARYPQLRIHDDEIGVLDRLGGGLRPELTVFSGLQLARAAGAQLHDHTRVFSIEHDENGVTVRTDQGVYHADQVVVTTGSWASELDPRIGSVVEVKPLLLTWFMPEDLTAFQPGTFPTFIRDRDGVHFFGAPSLEGYSVKISPSGVLPPVRSVADIDHTLSDEFLSDLGRKAQAFFPSLNPMPVHYSVHHDGFTDGKVPIIDRSADGRVVTFAGLSGHGFKFAPVFGELAAQLVAGETPDLYDERFSLAAHLTR
ncbi:N-methyl-L-tryptophan oxidase [Pseudoclavibacter soli]|uniref:N-methyl-L-tryptophan oxidase n=1 Tax=Pseudoclavibacter soli TaxID=452623 RepID=UPI0003FDE170|nr:N-methyl-L-tryptophan oxidase [Pseudoclavibacter soli]